MQNADVSVDAFMSSSNRHDDCGYTEALYTVVRKGMHNRTALKQRNV